MQAVLSYTETCKLARVRAPSMHLWLISMVRVLVLVVMLFALIQPAMAQEAKPDLSLEDNKQIMELADRVEAAVLIPDALLLTEVVRPEHGLFLDLYSDEEDAFIQQIPFSDIANMFSDFKYRCWGGADGPDLGAYGAIPYVLLGGSIHMVAQFPEGKDKYAQIVSLPDAMSRFNSKEIDLLATEPLNHFFAYEDEHYVQYFVQGPGNELNGHFWFLIVDKDEDGWYLKGITRMELWEI